MRVKCLAQEHNTMTPVRARTYTVDNHTKNYAITPLHYGMKVLKFLVNERAMSTRICFSVQQARKNENEKKNVFSLWFLSKQYMSNKP